MRSTTSKYIGESSLDYEFNLETPQYEFCKLINEELVIQNFGKSSFAIHSGKFKLYALES